jgi:hypothetical protein
MKKLFYCGIACLVLFELANVYFIMPLPFSQRSRSIDVAYFLYSWRWLFRVSGAILMICGAPAAWRAPRAQRWMAAASLALAALVVYAADFRMAAERIFLAPKALVMRHADQNTVNPARLVVGIEVNGDARAYPIQFIGYHHQVRDTVGGTPVLVSFCTVCRTGRVYSPIVAGRTELFRLVGMDHFNAMFEDRTTGSWWRQATGQAIAGPRRGAVLTELPSQQLTLAAWLALHPASLVMQPDSALRDAYAKSFDYETGASRSALTGTDTLSWHDQAWVVGLAVNGEAKAYDWNRLRRERIVNDSLGGEPVVIAIASDNASFVAYERPDAGTRFTIRGDSLAAGSRIYALSGRGTAGQLKPVFASQEFWHSWRTFHPGSKTY